MQIPVFHIYLQNKTPDLDLRSATLKERFVAQCLDGLFLSLLINLFLLFFSRGELYAVWISPLFPVYLLQASKTYLAVPADWWWGGYFVTVNLPYLAAFKLAYPSILQFAVYGLYYTLFHAWWGQTPGKMIRGLVVLTPERTLLSPGRAFLRWLAYLPSLVLGGMGIWWAEKHPQRATWPDHWTGSRVYAFLPWFK